ncbi:U11/U12 small nuclear ribonucleoprotein 48 kDa protein-like [Salvia divinorum]|uniref:U11/U12 small nuclear ribonucleoprotein 48 kDa protein-like n=1 Tax=Salvia divinorum TaxID=28513 RepID=A0ABD1HAG9_SALDI
MCKVLDQLMKQLATVLDQLMKQLATVLDQLMNMTEVVVRERETGLLERDMKTREDMRIEGKANQTGVVALGMSLMTDMILQSLMIWRLLSWQALCIMMERQRKWRKLCGGLGNRSFEGLVLVRVVVRLALQLSVLYGEVNGMYFAVDLFKESVLTSASDASLFSLEGKDDEVSEGGNVEEQVLSVGSIDETVGNSVIFSSQVAAAVAALHERSYFIEDKIKALRNDKPISTYQRNVKHAHVSKIADEERQNRPDYRPVIGYDGFLRHRPSNQQLLYNCS